MDAPALLGLFSSLTVSWLWWLCSNSWGRSGTFTTNIVENNIEELTCLEKIKGSQESRELWKVEGLLHICRAWRPSKRDLRRFQRDWLPPHQWNGNEVAIQRQRFNYSYWNPMIIDGNCSGSQALRSCGLMQDDLRNRGSWWNSNKKLIRWRWRETASYCLKKSILAVQLSIDCNSWNICISLWFYTSSLSALHCTEAEIH